MTLSKMTDYFIAILLFFPYVVSLCEVVSMRNTYYVVINILYVIALVLKDEYDLVLKSYKVLEFDQDEFEDDELQKNLLPIMDEKYENGENKTFVKTTSDENIVKKTGQKNDIENTAIFCKSLTDSRTLLEKGSNGKYITKLNAEKCTNIIENHF